MADAEMNPDETTGSRVFLTSDNPAPPVDYDLAPLVDEGYPPGAKGDWYQAQTVAHYWYFKCNESTLPPDFDKTGADGIEVLHYATGVAFLFNPACDAQGFVSGAPVTNKLGFGLLGVDKAKLFQFPEAEITANWDGSKGYLTKAQFEALEVRVDYRRLGVGDIDPPEE